jgi:hypothetical protein
MILQADTGVHTLKLARLPLSVGWLVAVVFAWLVYYLSCVLIAMLIGLVYVSVQYWWLGLPDWLE